MPLSPTTDVNLLEELHRHRQHHIGQINAWNVNAAITGVIAIFAVFGSDSISKLSAAKHVVEVMILLGIGLLQVLAATVLHWSYHATKVRGWDMLIQAELASPPGVVWSSPPATGNPPTPGRLPANNPINPQAAVNALGPNWFPAYWLVGTGVGTLLVGVGWYLFDKLSP